MTSRLFSYVAAAATGWLRRAADEGPTGLWADIVPQQQLARVAGVNPPVSSARALAARRAT